MRVMTLEEIERIQADPQFAIEMARWEYECAKERLEELTRTPQYSGLVEIEAAKPEEKKKQNQA